VALAMATITAMSNQGKPMNTGLVLICVVLTAAALAGCDRTKEADSRQKDPVSVANIQPPPQVPATATPTDDAKAPIQGQVDTKEPAQRKDFETK
jgi:hypothetical protein